MHTKSALGAKHWVFHTYLLKVHLEKGLPLKICVLAKLLLLAGRLRLLIKCKGPYRPIGPVSM
jgi:hypothetical protein